MKLITHTELHEKWMHDEIYRKEYEAELRREDASTSDEVVNEKKPDSQER